MQSSGGVSDTQREEVLRTAFADGERGLAVPTRTRAELGWGLLVMATFRTGPTRIT